MKETMATDTYRAINNLPKDVGNKLDFLKTKGFAHTPYSSSARYHRKVGRTDEEIVLRCTSHSLYAVEHTKINNTPLGRKVKSNTVKGQIAECLAFVEGLELQ